jgi:hypothetical protein
LSSNIEDDFYKFLGTIDEHHSGDYPDIEPWEYIAVWGIDFSCVSKTIAEKWLDTIVCIDEREDHFLITRVA